MITDLIQSSYSRLEGYRVEAELTVKRSVTMPSSRQSDAMTMLAGGGGGSGSSALPMFDQSQSKAARQYSHFRDVPYAAIRPIACKVADLPLHVGKIPRNRKGGGKSGPSGFRTKDVVPDFIKAMSEHVESIDGHAFIEDIMDPNPYMTHWAMMFCTVVSMYTTGKSFWWMDADPDGGTQFWYLPTTWVTPVASAKSAFDHYQVNPPWATGGGWPVPNADMAYFSLPDPSNPLASYAPLQSQARAIDTDDMVQEAQMVAMRDGVQPKTVITLGKTPEVPGIPGSGERIEITADQRKQLTNELMMWYAGAAKRGLPFIVDRKIEGIEPFGRSAAELDFINGAKVTSDRVHHGLGVNRIVTGATEGANRASAIVADTYFYALVVNPLGTHMSQTMTKEIGPRYSDDRNRVVIWIERAEAKDPALVQGRMGIAVKAGVATKGEVRRFAETGEIDFPPRDDDDELVSGESGGKGGPGAGGEGVPAAGNGGVPAVGDAIGGKPAAAPGDKTGAADGDVRDGADAKKSGGDELDWIMKGIEIGQRRAAEELQKRWNPSQSRDELGRWTSGGSSVTTRGGETLYQVDRDEDGVWRGPSGEPAPEHVQKIGIPPKWSDVHANPDSTGDMLVRGRDSKGRLQTVYSDSHWARAEADKFGRVSELRKKRGEILKEVDGDIKNGTPQVRENAICTKLIMQTGMRPGSDSDTKAKAKSYGATTLEGRHVIKNPDGTATLRFVPGKKHGQTIEMQVRDKALAKELITKSETAGPDGRIFNTNASSVRDYSKSKDGGGFKTKDHRTALGTEVAIEAIRSMPVPKGPKSYKSSVKKVGEEVAKVLGNTPAIAVKSYIDPQVFSAWRPSSGV